jgi:hypothetical protein
MGSIDLEDDDNRRYLKRVNSALARRGLTPDLSKEWEIRGPHAHMNYEVLVGEADGIWVSILPWTVHEVDGPDSWYKCTPENRIYCKKRVHRIVTDEDIRRADLWIRSLMRGGT